MIFYDRYKILEPYFQDDWRVTKRFTSEPGIALELFRALPGEIQQEFGLSPSQFSQANALGISPMTVR